MNYSDLWQKAYRRARFDMKSQEVSAFYASRVMSGRMRSRHAQRERWMREAINNIWNHF